MVRALRSIAAFALMVPVCHVLTAHAQKLDVTGVWKVTISSPDGQMAGYASLKQEGKSVTGRIGPAETDTMPLDGVLNDEQLTLTTHPQPGRTAAFVTCELTVTANRLSGPIDKDKGQVEFVRAKGD